MHPGRLVPSVCAKERCKSGITNNGVLSDYLSNFGFRTEIAIGSLTEYFSE